MADRAMPSRSSGGVEEAGHAVLDDLGQPADARRDHRHLARHRLERRQAEAFLRRRQQEHVGSGQQRHHLILLAEELHVVGRARAARASRDGFASISGPSPTISSRARHFAADLREDFDDRGARA